MTDSTRWGNKPRYSLKTAAACRTQQEARDAIIARGDAMRAWRAKHPDAEHEHRQRLAREGRDI